MHTNSACNHWRGHKWGAWGEPEEYAKPDEGAYAFKQRRTCERCNMVQYHIVQALSGPVKP